MGRLSFLDDEMEFRGVVGNLDLIQRRGKKSTSNQNLFWLIDFIQWYRIILLVAASVQKYYHKYISN